MIHEDSFTRRYALQINDDLTIDYIFIFSPEYFKLDKKCKNELLEVESNLRLFENYLKADSPLLPQFKNNACTFYGQFNGEYLLENFEIEFLETFQPTMLYDIICSNLGVWCDED